MLRFSVVKSTTLALLVGRDLLSKFGCLYDMGNSILRMGRTKQHLVTSRAGQNANPLLPDHWRSRVRAQQVRRDYIVPREVYDALTEPAVDAEMAPASEDVEMAPAEPRYCEPEAKHGRALAMERESSRRRALDKTGVVPMEVEKAPGPTSKRPALSERRAAPGSESANRRAEAARRAQRRGAP